MIQITQAQVNVGVSTLQYNHYCCTAREYVPVLSVYDGNTMENGKEMVALFLFELKMVLSKQRCFFRVACVPYCVFMSRLSNDARYTDPATLRTLPACICL